MGVLRAEKLLGGATKNKENKVPARRKRCFETREQNSRSQDLLYSRYISKTMGTADFKNTVKIWKATGLPEKIKLALCSKCVPMPAA